MPLPSQLASPLQIFKPSSIPAINIYGEYLQIVLDFLQLIFSLTLQQEQ